MYVQAAGSPLYYIRAAYATCCIAVACRTEDGWQQLTQDYLATRDCAADLHVDMSVCCCVYAHSVCGCIRIHPVIPTDMGLQPLYGISGYTHSCLCSAIARSQDSRWRCDGCAAGRWRYPPAAAAAGSRCRCRAWRACTCVRVGLDGSDSRPQRSRGGSAGDP